MKLLILLLFCTGFYNAPAQADLLVLKKKNQIIQTWIPGSIIDFQFSSKQWIQGRIKFIRRDSIVFEQFILRQAYNQFGFSVTDTAKMGLMKFHVKEIYGLAKRSTGASIFTNGALLQLGSGAYIFLNIFNSLIRKEQVFSARNLTGLGIAAGVFLVGKLLEWNSSSYIVLGKKYRMETIYTSTN